MFDRDALRTQVQLHNHIAMRDLPKRFATVQFLIVSIYVTGLHGTALALFAGLFLSEALGLWLIRTTPEAPHITPGRVAACLWTSSLISTFYYLPGVILAFQPDFGLAVGGIAWVLAALSTNLVMYNAIRTIFWTAALPGFPAALFVAAFGFSHPIGEPGSHTWILPASIIVLYIANTFQHLREYKDTHRELESTRAELLASLRRTEHLSLHDSLTGLKNRTSFQNHLPRMLSRTQPNRLLGVLAMDLNGFKPINDTYGHGVGDVLLEIVARRISEALRDDAAAFRLGGDEFVVLSHAKSAEELQALADRLIAEICQPAQIGKLSLTPAVSIGVGIADSPDHAPDALCAAADRAMYRAKTAGTGQSVIATSEDLTDLLSAERRAALEAALAAGAIVPYYQGQYSVAPSRLRETTMIGLEALARWPLPNGQVETGTRLVPDIAAMGRLPDLTRSILSQVLADLARWERMGCAPDRVSLNIPAVVLSTPDSVRSLTACLLEYRAIAGRLAFEITEDIYAARARDTIAQSLESFRAIGIEIHLDDFGTGHASYQHLRDTTPDVIKIDGSLVSELGTGTPAEVVIKGFASIAQGVGARVVAEQVETAAQRDILLSLGVRSMQGHLFSEAQPAALLALPKRVMAS